MALLMHETNMAKCGWGQIHFEPKWIQLTMKIFFEAKDLNLLRLDYWPICCRAVLRWPVDDNETLLFLAVNQHFLNDKISIKQTIWHSNRKKTRQNFRIKFGKVFFYVTTKRNTVSWRGEIMSNSKQVDPWSSVTKC